ncbi:MAG: hypothetical protein K0Q91_941 [Fibrobacteria bacterium]|jgi:hypothetical protein|nr:hypothetical protein [Fibrobacteria bacterium]
METLLKSFAAVLAFGIGASQACSFVDARIRYDTLETGVVRVVRILSYVDVRYEQVTTYDTLGISRITDFRSYFASALQDSSLVFIASLDSVLEFRNAGDTVVAGISPAFVLRDTSYMAGRWPFFARVRVDTVFRGTLPSTFWIRGATQGTSCDAGLAGLRHKPFLNISNGLQKPSDLKLPTYMTPYHNLPTAHWFDGRYLVSPVFPGIRLDITEVLPTYPATGILRRPSPTRSVAPGGKAYQPDGRRVEEAKTGRKVPVPLLK